MPPINGGYCFNSDKKIMLFIKDFARQLIPEWNVNTQLSIVCISTTNPVYLVFANQTSHPELVIRIADSEKIYKAHNITQQLFNEVGDLIPEPITISNFSNRTFAVQRGVKGTVWFQLGQGISTAAQWNELRGRAITALNQLHAGTRAIENWLTECTPGQELRDGLEKCIATGIRLPLQVKQQVEIMSQQLDRLGTITVFPQHGDYCLNNLIVDANAIHIIDFEDFGITSMPLHDEFSLALSMYAQAPKGINSSIFHELKICTASAADSLGIDSAVFPSFFMHHLLLRLGEWSHNPRRKQYREWLISILESFIIEPHLFFDQAMNQK